MLDQILIANRGEIACRIIRTLDRLNIQSISEYTAIDRHAPHVNKPYVGCIADLHRTG
jgi:urea carboxylase